MINPFGVKAISRYTHRGVLHLLLLLLIVIHLSASATTGEFLTMAKILGLGILGRIWLVEEYRSSLLRKGEPA